MTDATTSRLPVPDAEPDRSSTVQHVTVEDDDVTVCTMFPQDVTDPDLARRWITADGESFVSLEDAR